MILFVFSDHLQELSNLGSVGSSRLKETAALLLLTDRHTSLTARGQWASRRKELALVLLVKCPKCFIDLPISDPMFWSS